MTASPYNASDIAKYFIFLASQQIVGDEGELEGITNLKLQKILYLAQAYFLAKFDRPLFGDRIEAWQYGPVVPEIYQEYKVFGNKPIVDGADVSSISSADKDALKAVWDAFGGYSANRLVSITHAHSPWKEAFNSEDNVITTDSIRDFYTPLLNG